MADIMTDKQFDKIINKMEIHIRNSRSDEYQAVEAIMKQVQQMHIEWRPDIYRDSATVLPFEIYEQAVNARNGAAYKFYSDYGFTDKSINMELL